MGEKLESLLLEYLSGLEAAKDKADAGDPSAYKAYKPVNYIVITDGVPSLSNLRNDPISDRADQMYPQRTTQSLSSWLRHDDWMRGIFPSLR
jgi:hypothetical protein